MLSFLTSSFEIETLGPLPPPTVSRESKRNYSVILEWTGIVHPNVTYYLQMKVIDTNSDWQILNSTSLQTNGQIEVGDLHPYVTYKVGFIDDNSMNAKFNHRIQS